MLHSALQVPGRLKEYLDRSAFVLLAWYPSRDVFGRSREFARDKRSIAIMCSTDGTSYQALGSAVSSASSS